VNSLLSANAELIITVVKIVLLLFIVLTVNAYLTWFERKVVAHMQSRVGAAPRGPARIAAAAGGRLEISFQRGPDAGGSG